MELMGLSWCLSEKEATKKEREKWRLMMGRKARQEGWDGLVGQMKATHSSVFLSWIEMVPLAQPHYYQLSATLPTWISNLQILP